MSRRALKTITFRPPTWLLVALLAASLSAQEPVKQQPAVSAPTLKRVEATDSASGVQYVRLLLFLPPGPDASQTLPPRFTVECLETKGKHEMLWFVSFGGVEDPGFEPPFRPTLTDPFPPRYPGVNLKMTFEGYIKWKPFIRSWSLLPSGELQYRNAGSSSPNMEAAQSFLQYLNSLPGLRIGYAKPAKGDPGDLFFPMQPVLDELKKTPICPP